MIRSAIDLGTNTCLLLVGQWDSVREELKQVLCDAAQVVRLGQGVDVHRALQAVPMQRTLDCLKTYSAQVRALGGDPTQTICVATSQARDATNSKEFFDRIRIETGFSFQVLSGDQEARTTFEGTLLPGMSAESCLVIDIGGGSTEVMTVSQAVSLDLGSVRFTERYLKSDPVTDVEFKTCLSVIDQALQQGLESFPRQGMAVAVAGTATTLAAWKLGLPQFDSAQVETVVLSVGDLQARVETLKGLTIRERAQLPGMEPMRADVILAGAMILWRVLVALGQCETRVSPRGLRYGALKLKS